MNSQEILWQTVDVIKNQFFCDDQEIGRETMAMEVDGWDSLAQTLLMLNLGKRFGIRIPISDTYSLSNVGELVDFIQTMLAGNEGMMRS